MAVIGLPLPELGELNATEDPKWIALLEAMRDEINGLLDSANFKPAGLSDSKLLVPPGDIWQPEHTVRGVTFGQSSARRYPSIEFESLLAGNSVHGVPLFVPNRLDTPTGKTLERRLVSVWIRNSTAQTGVIYAARLTKVNGLAQDTVLSETVFTSVTDVLAKTGGDGAALMSMSSQIGRVVSPVLADLQNGAMYAISIFPSAFSGFFSTTMFQCTLERRFV